MKNPFVFIAGYAHLTFDIKYAADILNVCMRHSLVYRRQRSDGKTFSFECSLLTAQKLLKICEKSDIVPIKIKKGGIPRIFSKYKKRYGIYAGLIVASLIIVFSGLFLWEIQIEGEERLNESEIRQTLSDCGLYVGARLSHLKTDTIQTKVMLTSDDIAWIAINLSGNVAHVEIREHVYKTEDTGPRAANLVAECDGEIVLFEEVRGNIVTEIGDLVRKGELLVSGIFDSDTIGFRYTEARGEVLARVSEDYHIEIPLEYEKKIYSGRTFCEKYLIFFGREVKFFSNCRNLPPKCDTIDTIENINIFYGRKLPFAIRTVSYLEYDVVLANRSPDDAVELALDELKVKLRKNNSSDILSKSFNTELTDNAYILDCTVECIKNIARQVEIEVSE